MKFLLLVVVLDCDLFWLAAGSEASSDLSVCADGWVEFSCSYPNRNITRYHSVEVFTPRKQETLQSSESDRWEDKGSALLYHDTTNRNLRVTIKKIHIEDFNQFQCRFYPGPGSDHEISNVDLVPADPCQTSSQTVNTAGETTLTCRNRGKKLPILFFCKENDSICEEILSTSSSVSKGRFTLRVTPPTFSLSISDVSSEDAGVYWCGGKPDDGRYRAPITKIQLEVKVRPRSTSPSAEPHVSLSSTTSSVRASPSSGSATPGPDGGDGAVVAAVLVLVALLVVVLLLVVVYKRLKKTNGKAAIITEDHVYAEIQEKTDSGTVMNVLYVSATFPMKPRVSAMEPRVQNRNHSSTAGEELYSTINLPQQD